ncbi:MAG: lipid II flippase MurJ [Chloroflexota bacterium]
MKKLSSLTRTSLLLIFLFAFDKVLALGRATLSLETFGLTHDFDAFNAANNLPDLLFALISGGALAMAFIPILSSTLTLKGRDALWDVFSRVANLAFLGTAIVSLFVAIFADQIVKAEIGITPGFSPELQDLVADLMRLNLIATLIFSVSGLVMAGLQANQHFLFPALAPIMYNVGQLIGIFFLVPALGIYGLVYGALLGAALHLLIQVPGLVKYKFRWTPAVTINNPEVIEALKLVGPRLLTMFMIQLMFIARDNLASRLDQEGAVSALTFGWMIMQVPETILGTAIATALLPTLSEHAARGNWDGFRETVEKAIRVLIALTLPIAAVMAAGMRPLIGLVFSSLSGTEAALLTLTVRVYLVTLCGYSIHEIAVRAFYARKEALYPLAAVAIRLAIYLAIGITALLFFRDIGAPGIAFAEFALTIEAIILFIWLSRRLHEPLQIDGVLLRGLIAALLGGALAYGLALYVPGSAVLTALLGMAVGGILALVIVWKEARLIFNL